jgi:1,2-diacylglycerol 3-alpha-glucosyltransferase
VDVLLANLTYRPHFGGIENSLYYMAKAFQGLGHRVVILASDAPVDCQEVLPEYELIEGIEVHRFRRKIRIPATIRGAADTLGGHQLVRRLRSRFEFKLAVVRNASVGLGVSLALDHVCVVYVLPAVHSLQDRKAPQDFAGPWPVRWLRYWLYTKVYLGQANLLQRRLICRATQSFVFSQSMRRQVVSKWGMSNRLLVVRPGVDSAVFQPRADRSRLRSEFGIERDTFVLLVLGRLVKVKGIDLAIRAVAASGAQVQLAIVGSGPEAESLGELTARLDLSSRVHFHPATDKPEAWYGMADAFLMTSTYEPFGQTILEAMASGLPVIGFRADGSTVVTATDEIVEDVVNGYLADYGVESLVEAIDRCRRAPSSVRDEMSRRNRETAQSLFAWPRLCDTLLEVAQ